MLPSFHDGRLTGLSVSERATTLSVIREGGLVWRIELLGVRFLKADDFREGNIISYCEVVSHSEPSRALLEAVAIGPHESAAQEYHDQYRLFIDDIAEQVRNGSLSLFYLEPSYGCEVIAICEGVEATEAR